MTPKTEPKSTPRRSKIDVKIDVKNDAKTKRAYHETTRAVWAGTPPPQGDPGTPREAPQGLRGAPMCAYKVIDYQRRFLEY